MLNRKKFLTACVISLCVLLFTLTGCSPAYGASGSASAHPGQGLNQNGLVSSASLPSTSKSTSGTGNPSPSGISVQSASSQVTYAPSVMPNENPPRASSSSAASSAPQRKPEHRARGIRVLFYHHIMTTPQKGSAKNGLVMTTDEFDHQMAILKDAGYQTASLDDLYAYISGTKSLNPQNTIILTFDDGYRTNGYLAAPILRKYGFKATVFIITKFMACADSPVNTTTYTPFQYFIYSDLPQFADTLSYASHTDNMHDNYKGDAMLITEPDQAILTDLQLSRSKLNNTPYFAYPFGKFSDHTIELLKKAGFTMAFTTKQGMVYPGTDYYRVPRYEINSPITDARFKFLAGISS